MNFCKFPDIELFHNVVKTGEFYNFPVLHYRSKIKLHGTNAAVRIKDGVVGAQSRSRLITPEDDNEGFAKWVKANEAWFAGIPFEEKFGSTDIAVFGEWCGPGIMTGTAINKIPHKCFVIFAIFAYNWKQGNYIAVGEDNAMVLTEPADIEALLVNKPKDVYVLPWHCDTFRVEFGHRDQLQEVAARLNKFVEEIEPCDPWVKATFGIEGTAEGAVYYPVSETGHGQSMRHWFSDYVFKAKGEQHKVIKTKQAVQVDPEVAKSIEEFVTMFVTLARLNQGLNAVGGKADAKNTGAFLKWFMGDVLKESVDELAAANLTWDNVSRAVSVAARTWFLAKSKEL
jgi:hypothetical protein